MKNSIITLSTIVSEPNANYTRTLPNPFELFINKTRNLISADEAWSESAWKEAVWFDDEANILRTLCRRRGPGKDQAHHREDADVS